MSAETGYDPERRIRELEQRYVDLLAKVRQVDALARNALQKALTAPQPQGGGGSNPLLLAWTPSGGIPFCTVNSTGGPTALVITPGQAMCSIYRVSGTTTSYVGTFTVYNPYTSGTSTPIGGVKLIPVIQDEAQNLWAIGEPCP